MLLLLLSAFTLFCTLPVVVGGECMSTVEAVVGASFDTGAGNFDLTRWERGLDSQFFTDFDTYVRYDVEERSWEVTQISACPEALLPAPGTPPPPIQVGSALGPPNPDTQPSSPNAPPVAWPPNPPYPPMDTSGIHVLVTLAFSGIKLYEYTGTAQGDLKSVIGQEANSVDVHIMKIREGSVIVDVKAQMRIRNQVKI